MVWHPSDRLFRQTAADHEFGQNTTDDSSDQSGDEQLPEGVTSTGSEAQDAAMGVGGIDTPPSCSYCGSTQFKDQTDNGRAQQATCAVCGGTMSSVDGNQWTPELIGDPSNHPSPGPDPASGGVGGAANATDALTRDPSRRASLHEAGRIRHEDDWTYEKTNDIFNPTKATGPDGQERKDKYFGTGLTQVRHPEHLPTPMYHGTPREIEGDHIEPGHPGNFVRRMKHVYMTDDPNLARNYAGHQGNVYEVQPTGWYGHRSDAKGASWASEDPLRIVREVPSHESPGYDSMTGEVRRKPLASLRVTALSWDEIGARHPQIYGDEDVHGEEAEGADGPSIGEAANSLAHERAEDPDAESHSVHDLDFHEQTVHPRHIDYSPSGVNDGRVTRAREGYRLHPEQMPPLVLVHRHGVYQVADGHHRAEAAHGLNMPVKAYVAHSPYPDEPFRDGEKAPFYRAEPTERHHMAAAPVTGLNATEAIVSEPDWCGYRHVSHCWYPSTPMSGPQDRGVCPWTTAWEQAVCPISDPGPMAVIRAKSSMEHVAEDEDWRLQHRAPGPDDVSAPLHDVTAGIFPKDFHEHPEWYAPGHDFDHESFSVIRAARGNPEKKVKIYRAIPAEHAHKGIGPGDWVSTSKSYARLYGKQHDPKHDWPVISTSVPAKHLHTEGDIHEWGYSGPHQEATTVAFKGGYHQEVRQHADGIVRPVQRKPRDSAQQLKDQGGRTAGLRQQSACPTSDPGPVDVDLRTLAKVAQNDPDFAFHFTAAWSDVRAKATRIRREGGVRITVASNDGVAGEVKGDHHVYESALTFQPGSRKIGTWNCGCRWAAFAWGRSAPYKRFEGRMCSHSYAMQLEAQARGMFGKEIHEDADRPAWLKPHSPVVVQNNRDTNRNRTRRAVPGNMRSEWTPKSRVRIKGAYESADVDPLQVQRALDRTRDEEHEKHQDDAKYVETYEPLHKSDLDPDRAKQFSFHHNTDPTPNPFRDLLPEHTTLGVGPHEAPVPLTHYKSPVAMEPLHLDEHGNAWRRNYEWSGPKANYPDWRGWSGPHSATETLDQHPTWSTSQDAEGNRQQHMRTHSEREQIAHVLPGETAHEITLRRNRNLAEHGWNVLSSLRPVTALVRIELDADEDPPAIIKILQQYGLTHAAAKEVLDEALGRVASWGDDEQRCPHCGGYLGPQAFKAGQCPHCGHAIAHKEAAARESGEHEELKEKRKHKTDDARKHAPDFGHGVPGWVGPIGWCTQCGGSGCGHCGGSGQVGQTGPDSPNTTSDPIPDQNGDQGPMMSDGISSVGKGKKSDAPFVSGMGSAARHSSGTSFPIVDPTADQTAAGSIGFDFDSFGRVGMSLGANVLPGVDGGWTDSGQYVAPSGSQAEMVQPHAQTVQAEFAARTTSIPVVAGMIDDELGWDLSYEQQPHEALRIEVPAFVEGSAVAIRPSGSDPHVAAIAGHEQDLAKQARGKQKVPSVAGVFLKAQDTGRVLMIQRSNSDQKDPARGTWEAPGGHIEPGDTTTLHAGIREWQEEVGQPFPDNGVVHHVWHSPDGVYAGHLVVVPSEKEAVDFSNGRATVNPDDPDGDDHEQSAWWEVDHARKNPALRSELKKDTPWAQIAKAGEQKTASAWDSLESLNPPPGRGVEEPSHSNSQNPASSGFLTAADPESWDQIGDSPSTFAPSNSFDATLHDHPEPALPSTDGAEDDAEDDTEDDAYWVGGYQPPETHGEISPVDSSFTPDSFHMGSDSTTADIVARFQTTAGAQALQSSGPAQGGGMNVDIAAAARAHLAGQGGSESGGNQRTALKRFDFAEQQELITEGARDKVRARNFGDLQIEGTHYEHLQNALTAQGLDADDEILF